MGRPIERILTEWRAAERELEASNDDDRDAIVARIAALRDEHRAAIAEREREAEELRR
jgi:hypothetical protein